MYAFSVILQIRRVSCNFSKYSISIKMERQVFGKLAVKWLICVSPLKAGQPFTSHANILDSES